MSSNTSCTIIQAEAQVANRANQSTQPLHPLQRKTRPESNCHPFGAKRGDV